jgi:AcrR family transcriptional regulator
MTDAQTRRERRAATRQSQILEAAARVFAEKGFRHATIRDVAEAAEVADGTIYNYFENKDALLNAIINQLAEAEQQPLEVDPSRIADRMRQLRTQYDQVMAVLPEILGSPDLRERYYQQFVLPVVTMIERDQIAQGNDRPLGEIQLSARMLLCAVMGFQVLMILGDPLVHDAWNNPEELARIWAKFIACSFQ